MTRARWRDMRTRFVDALTDRRDDALDRFDDAWYAITDRFPGARRFLAWTTAVVTILIAVAVLGPVVRSGLSAPTSGAGSAQLPAGAPPSPSNLPVADVDASEPLTTVGSAARPEAGVTEPVQTIAIVPPMRDVIVVVDGVELVSDSSGSIAVPVGLRDGSFSFVGVREQPPLRQVAFGQWADGNRDGVRSLAELTGPVAELGVIVRRRVTVTTTTASPSGTEVRLDSQTGPISLVIDTPTWIDAERATFVGGSLLAEELRYTADGVLLDGAVRPIPTQEFAPSPEARWVVDVGSALDPGVAPTTSQP